MGLVFGSERAYWHANRCWLVRWSLGKKYRKTTLLPDENEKKKNIQSSTQMLLSIGTLCFNFLLLSEKVSYFHKSSHTKALLDLIHISLLYVGPVNTILVFLFLVSVFTHSRQADHIDINFARKDWEKKKKKDFPLSPFSSSSCLKCS